MERAVVGVRIGAVTKVARATALLTGGVGERRGRRSPPPMNIAGQAIQLSVLRERRSAGCPACGTAGCLTCGRAPIRQSAVPQTRRSALRRHVGRDGLDASGPPRVLYRPPAWQVCAWYQAPGPPTTWGCTGFGRPRRSRDSCAPREGGAPVFHRPARGVVVMWNSGSQGAEAGRQTCRADFRAAGAVPKPADRLV